MAKARDDPNRFHVHQNIHEPLCPLNGKTISFLSQNRDGHFNLDPVCQFSYLACEHKICIHGHGCAICDEIGDRLHDIPGILPPGQSGQDAELGGHVGHAAPQHPSSALLRLPTQLLLHLYEKQVGAGTHAQCVQQVNI